MKWVIARKPEVITAGCKVLFSLSLFLFFSLSILYTTNWLIVLHKDIKKKLKKNAKPHGPKLLFSIRHHNHLFYAIETFQYCFTTPRGRIYYYYYFFSYLLHKMKRKNVHCNVWTKPMIQISFSFISSYY